jgi:hypothetical protein
MKKKVLRFLGTLVLAICILVVGGVAYFISEKNVLATIAAFTFMYTISKPIQNELDEWVKKDKKLKVCSIYSKNESDFEKDINSKIEELTKEGCTIEALNVLSTKRAIIQYRK